LEAIKDPNKDTHPRAQLLKDWTKTKEKQKESPTPERKKEGSALVRSFLIVLSVLLFTLAIFGLSILSSIS
jgi:hypothetical protein